MVEEGKEENPSKTSENKPERDEQGRLLPGNTANPNGRPKFSLVSILKDLLKEVPEGEKVTVAEKLMRVAIRKALEGDTYLMKDLINRIDGLPKQSIGFDVGDLVTELNIIIKAKKDDSKPGVNDSVPKELPAVGEKGKGDNNK